MIVGIALGLLCIAAAYRLAGALHNAFWRKQEKPAAPPKTEISLYTRPHFVSDYESGTWAAEVERRANRQYYYYTIEAERVHGRVQELSLGTAQKKEKKKEEKEK